MRVMPSQALSPVPPFLADVAAAHLDELVVVHTGRRTYTGRLIAITAACVVLDADSDALDQEVYTRIDTSRIEAIELLSP